MPLDSIIQHDSCVVATLATATTTNHSDSVFKQLAKQLESYLDAINMDINGIQKKWLTYYEGLLEDSTTSNQVLQHDLAFLKECGLNGKQPIKDSKLLADWLSDLDSYHKQTANHTTHKLLAKNKTHVLLKIKSDNDSDDDIDAVCLPLYQSMFYQENKNKQTDILNFPSVTNLFDLFDDDWFQAIDASNTAALKEFGYQLAQPNGQLVIRWAIDFSDYFAGMGISTNNANLMIDGFPRTVAGKSAGSAFAVAVLQLLAKSYLSFPELFASS